LKSNLNTAEWRIWFLLKKLNICSDIFTFIFTKSIQLGKVPSDWDHAKATPVQKGGQTPPWKL